MTTDMRALLAAAVENHRALRLDEAERLYHEILRLDPGRHEALHLLGLIAHQRGDSDAAIALIEAALAKSPGTAAYHVQLAVVRGEQGDLAAAETDLRHAIAAEPGNVRAHCLLAHTLQGQGKLRDAAQAYEHALSLDPGLPEALNNLALIYRARGDLPAAADRLARAVVLKPAYADAHYNHGLILEQLGRLNEAMASYERARTLAPNHTGARWNESLLRLLMGDFERGWKLYEARTQRGVTGRADAPPWTGEHAPGKTLLLHAEQGFGDAIQFSRYVALARASVGRVHLQCNASLVRLLRTVPGVDEVSASGTPVTCDMQAPLLSLPLIHATTLESIPASVPYVRPDAADIARWRARLKPGLNIGLVWRGAPANVLHARRIIAPELIAEILPAAPAHWISLQIDTTPQELAALASCGPVSDFGREVSDWADTAALVSQLDLVITVDTGVAHLAGALARPCWIMLPAIPDWRWMLERSDSPWYPSVTLIRQSTPGDWAPVIADVQRRLRALQPG